MFSFQGAIDVALFRHRVNSDLYNIPQRPTDLQQVIYSKIRSFLSVMSTAQEARDII